MIIVRITLNQEEVIALLENYSGDDFTYKLDSRQGMQLKFAVTGEAEAAAKKAKALIKAEEWGTNLYFSVITG